MEALRRGKVCFPDLARTQIVAEFVRQKQKQARMPGEQLDHEAETFLLILESFAEGIPHFQGYEPPDQQRRREQLKSIALHLAELSAKIESLDSAALGYLLHCTLSIKDEPASDNSPEANSMSLMSMARDLAADTLPLLADFGLGAQLAAKSLPLNTFDYRLRIALAVERQFWEQGFKFSITETGFAALCLRSIFETGGASATAIKYWLRIARENNDSMCTFDASMKDRFQE